LVVSICRCIAANLSSMLVTRVFTPAGVPVAGAIAAAELAAPWRTPVALVRPF
jgi:hypothetical protein